MVDIVQNIGAIIYITKYIVLWIHNCFQKKLKLEKKFKLKNEN